MKTYSTFRIYPNEWLLPYGAPSKIPELGFDLNAVEFIIWSQRYMVEETGQIWDSIRIACLRQDANFLEQFPFIERIYVGRARANREHIPAVVRRQVLAAGQCAYCGSVERLTIDHIKPYSKGGTHDISNLQCLCWPCNRQKSNKEEI